MWRRPGRINFVVCWALLTGGARLCHWSSRTERWGSARPTPPTLSLYSERCSREGRSSVAQAPLLCTPSAPRVGSADPPGKRVSTSRPRGHDTQLSQGALPLTRDPGELSTAPGRVLSSSPEPRVPLHLLLSLGGPGEAA